ncbi:DUF6351 family protein [soil metagenome]
MDVNSAQRSRSGHRSRVGLALATIAASLAAVSSAPAANPGLPAIETVSAPAAFVSGGQVLVRVHSVAGPIAVNGVDATAQFKADGADRLGLVRDLRIGDNRITAGVGKGAAALTIKNHDLQGPILSGPHMKPFICQTQDFKLPDGGTLGPSQGENCIAPTRIEYLYKPKGATALKYLPDAAKTPADADMTTTLDGATVPFVVRTETGVINRAIYQFAVLHNPATDGAVSAFNSPKGWARRLLAVHGTGCPRGWYIQGSAMGVSPLDAQRLGQGLAVFTSTLNHPTNSCNAVLAGETTLMVRQHVIETLGVPVYTLTTGSSGGAYTSLQIADAFPGLFDATLTAATFPDALVVAIQGSDGRLLNHYSRDLAPNALTAAQQQAIGGYALPIGLQANGNQSGRTDPVPERKDQEAYASAVFNPAVPAALRYDPKTNPTGARPTVFDEGVNIYGRDPKTGFARRPFDNVGVQYGLKALNDGVITKAQFLDLNARVGGLDQDTNYISARSIGDATAIAHAYQAGMMLSGSGGLKGLPMLDYSGIYSDLRPTGDFHMKHHHFEVRQRLKHWNGTADNMVMWSDGGRAVPAAGAAPTDADLSGGSTGQEAFKAMDAWLIAIAGDKTPGTKMARTLRNKPKGLTDGCFTAEHRFIAEPQAPYTASACNRLYPTHSFPRAVAGTPLSADVLKCALKPVSNADYKTPFTPAELAKLKAIFPAGVCDWSKLGQGQQPVRPWSIW